jgi:hypothetical protein
MPPAPRVDSRIEKWLRWLREAEDDLIGVAWNRAIYNGLGEIGDANPDIPPSPFFEFLGEAYATTQAVAVRRQAEYNRQGSSFGTLLHEIKDDSGRLTRERYIALHDDEDAQAWATENWEKRFGGTVDEHLDRKIVEQDIAELAAAVEPIKTYVDKHVAHRDNQRSDPPTFGDLNNAVDTFEKLVSKYGNLLRGAGLIQLEPTPQEDWTAVFRVPWIKEPRGAASS